MVKDTIIGHKTGLSMSINSVVLVAIGLVVLGATGVLVGTSQADTADTADQIASDAQCDTWATQSTTAGNPDEADNAEQQYNENCEGNLDDVIIDRNFVASNYGPEDYEPDYGYDREDHEDDSIIGGRNPNVRPVSQVSGSYNIGSGQAMRLDECISIHNQGRSDGLIKRTSLTVINECDSDNTISGSATGSSNGCKGELVSGIPVSRGGEGSGTTLDGDCVHSGIINTAEGEKKLAMCEYGEVEDQSTSEGTIEVLRIAVGEPGATSAQICQAEGASTGNLGGGIEPSTGSGDTDSTGSGNSDTSDGSDGTSSSGNADSGGDSGMEGAVVVHFSPTSQVNNPESRIQAYQDGIKEHTPFGNACPIEFQTDETGDRSEADIKFTVTHEYSGGAAAQISSTHAGGDASGTLYEGIATRHGNAPFGEEVMGATASHEVLHEFRMCEEYDRETWQRDENRIYNDVGGCINQPWDEPVYDYEPGGDAGICTGEPVSGVSGRACGAPTESGYSVMGQPNLDAQGGVLVYGDLKQSGIPADEVEPLKQFIEEHAGVECR